MSSETTYRNVPLLRFKEYHEEWNLEPLHKIYSFKITNSLSRDNLNYNKGQVKNIHYGDIHTKFSTLFDITKESVPYINEDVLIDRIDQENYCEEGDIIFADASEDLEDVGKSIEVVNLNGEKLLSGLHTFLARQIEKKLVLGFGGYLFKSEDIRNQIKREAQGAKVLGISKGRISNIQIYYPKEESEQQKIAACLFSLDELITAESQKLDALKDHKKGLLQNLFPAEGETIPQLRFPEFEKDGEWEESPLGNLTKTTIGEFVIKTKQNPKSPYPVYNGGRSYTGFYNEYNNEANKIIISARGANAGYVNLIKQKYWAGNSCYSVSIDDEDDLNLDFLFFYIKQNQKRFTDNQQAANIPSVSKGDVEGFVICYPSNIKEQQKIAACLSSLDEQINDQAVRLDELKAHKKGLMQQMFPVLNEQ